jgi:hypothetical protein
MGKLICPHCGDATAPTAFSFHAAVTVKNTALAPIMPTYPYEEGTAHAITVPEHDQPTYGIMVCQSCGKHFVAEKEADEWVAVYPIKHKPVAKEILEPVKSEFEEANLCFAIGAYKACISMCMTALEAAWKDKKVSSLKELKDNGTISENLFRRADQVRRWANVVKHQLIHEVVTREEAEQLISYLEQILDAVYVEEKRFSDLTQKLGQIEKPTKP